MYSLRLINMPFAALQFPSLALTQLQSLVRADCAGSVDVRIVYANHDFARCVGLELYQDLATMVRHGMTGLGDWLFRQAAFPDQGDNADEYFARCYPERDEATQRFRQSLLRLRGEIDTWLDELIGNEGLARADMVGLTSLFAQNLACLALARKLKERNAAVVTAMGGANCEFPMGWELVQNFAMVDFVFSGPAHRSFPRLVGHQMRGEAEACHRIDGVFSRSNIPDWPPAAESARLGGEACGPARVKIFGEELDIETPIPLDYSDYLSRAAQWEGLRPALLFETSRGCWWGERAHCTFCGLNGLTMKYRPMSPAAALEQFAALFRYAERVPRLTLQCVDNILPREYLQEVFPHLDTPPGIDVFYEVKADLSEQEVAVLARARVTSIQPGIEALATSTLRLMKKGTTAFHGISLLKNCLAYGLRPQWNLLIGFPGENADVYHKYQRDLPQFVHLPPPTGVFPVRFDRYSPYFARPEAYGLDLRPYDFYALIYGLPDDSLRRLAYFFMDNNFHADYIAQMVQWIGPLAQLTARWRLRHLGLDGGAPATLVFEQREDGHYVVDTRSGTVVEYPVEPDSLRLLQALARPLDRRRLFLETGIDRPALDRHLESLLQQGLLFEEDGRFLTLVTRTQSLPRTA